MVNQIGPNDHNVSDWSTTGVKPKKGWACAKLKSMETAMILAFSTTRGPTTTNQNHKLIDILQ